MTQHAKPIDSAVYQRAIAHAHDLRAQAINQFFAGLGTRLARGLTVEIGRKLTAKPAQYY